MKKTELERYKHIFEANKRWVQNKTNQYASFFEHLAQEHNPDFLYIGCSDSRVHANEIMGLSPGEVFVHRNIANMVINTDLNALSVINYAVEYLNVKHIIICGHYGCGGIDAAMKNLDFGILNPWLRGIRDVYRLHSKTLDAIEDRDDRLRKLAEINVYEQCLNVTKTAEVQKSFHKTGYPIVAGWIYDIRDGYLHDLNFDFENELKRIKQTYDITTNK